ncbi:MAG: D-Ala-D-Ala carboxypeptidase family metallohydrolase [Elusimicrobiota bacterium]
MIKNKILSGKNISTVILLNIFLVFCSSHCVKAQEHSIRPGFSVEFKNNVCPYNVTGVFVMPGEILEFRIDGKDKTDLKYTIKASTGNLQYISSGAWKWTAPKSKGLYEIEITETGTAKSILMNVFVMVPRKEKKGEYLNGYRIGYYEKIALKGLAIYQIPEGFIEVTKENQDTLLSPHFKLKQFICKQKSGYPKYMVLKEKLILKLEMVLEKLNEKGYKTDTIHTMSGYRTPYYNKAIGNVKYSRHLYGGAADIFIDENPKDGNMDDLNKDGRIDYHDAVIVYDIIDSMYGKEWYRIFHGGLGWYKKTKKHGPFVHVDVRGFRARWGD